MKNKKIVIEKYWNSSIQKIEVGEIHFQDDRWNKVEIARVNRGFDQDKETPIYGISCAGYGLRTLEETLEYQLLIKKAIEVVTKLNRGENI
jgi:hypothetical protein